MAAALPIALRAGPSPSARGCVERGWSGRADADREPAAGRGRPQRSGRWAGIACPAAIRRRLFSREPRGPAWTGAPDHPHRPLEPALAAQGGRCGPGPRLSVVSRSRNYPCSMPTISFVIPVRDEEEVLPELHRRLDAVAGQIEGDCEFILVDDGSADRSREVMSELRAHDERVKLLFLARNFGHQLAISAGLDFASGDAVVIMDSDLQDPPEVVLEMIPLWREGYEVVHAVRRGTSGREPDEALDRAPLLSAPESVLRRQVPGRRRGLQAGGPPGGRRRPRHARARPVPPWDVRLGRLPADEHQLRPRRAVRGQDQELAGRR